MVVVLVDVLNILRRRKRVLKSEIVLLYSGVLDVKFQDPLRLQRPSPRCKSLDDPIFFLLPKSQYLLTKTKTDRISFSLK